MGQKYSGFGAMAVAIFALARQLGGYENKPLAIGLIVLAVLLVCVLVGSASVDYISWARKRRNDNRIVLIVSSTERTPPSSQPVWVFAAAIASLAFVLGVAIFVLYPRPDLRLTLLGGNIFVPNGDNDLTGLALDVRIHNIGTPTIATGWKLEIRNTNTTRAQLTKQPELLTLNGAARQVVLHASDSLERKAIYIPLRDGEAPREGWLLFYVPLTKHIVQSSDTILHLSVEDSRGHEFHTDQRMGDWLQR